MQQRKMICSPFIVYSSIVFISLKFCKQMKHFWMDIRQVEKILVGRSKRSWRNVRCNKKSNQKCMLVVGTLEVSTTIFKFNAGRNRQPMKQWRNMIQITRATDELQWTMGILNYLEEIYWMILIWPMNLQG